MKQHLKTLLKKTPFLYEFAGDCYRITVETIKRTSSFISFWVHMLLRRPYFGYRFYAQQLWQSRAIVMRKLLKKELMKHTEVPYQLLEIGSWAGESAVLWAQVLKESGKEGRIFCIDIWTPFAGEPRVMESACKNNRILKLFWHNIESSGYGNLVSTLRGSSNTFASLFKEESFDLIYVDGSHVYDQVKRDLLQYKLLLKWGGVICGDDLEVQQDEIDVSFAKGHAHVDGMIHDPKTMKIFHPGVTLAVDEIFGNVSVKNGFWAMRRTRNGWASVEL